MDDPRARVGRRVRALADDDAVDRRRVASDNTTPGIRDGGDDLALLDAGVERREHLEDAASVGEQPERAAALGGRARVRIIDVRQEADVLEDLASQHEGFVDELGWHIVRTDEVPAGSRRSIPDGAVDALDALFGLAEDEDLDERDRVAAVSATGRLRIWDPRIAELVRDRANAPRIRRAAAKALVDADSASSRQATARLLKRLDANPDDDPGGGIRKILIRAPVEGRSR